MLKYLKRHWLIAAAAASCVAIGGFGYAWAQGILPLASPTGSELVTVLPIQPNGSPAATQATVTLNQIRNSSGYQLLAAASGTISPTNAINTLAINAQPAASTTINTPAAPFDGEFFQVCNVSNAAWVTNTVTLAPAAGSSFNTGVVTALTTLGARTCEELLFDLATTTWYQIR